MKLFFYYFLHSAKNGLKKLFKTWVLVFFVVMLVGGLILGGTIGLLLKNTLPDDIGTEETDSSQAEAVLPDPEEEVPVMDILELAAGGIILLFFVISVFRADKTGADIFLPADVTLLFPSPMKPQSVLLFRTTTQIGASVAASVYFLGFQIPRLVRKAQFPWWIIPVIFAGWILMLAIAQLLKMLCFVACSTRPALRKNLRRIVYLALALIAGGFCLFHTKSGLGWWEDVRAFFNAPKSRLIPFWGWIKGFVMYAAEGKSLPLLLCFAGTLLGGGALAWLIWHMRADFYEEALQKASEKSEMMAAAQDAQSGNVIIKRKKDRSEKIRRNAFHHGWGAGVFFHKPLYNRFRFAHLGIFTKTLEFNLAVALGGAALCRFVLNTDNVWIIVILLALGTFFRSLGNSLREDTQMWYFLMIPEDNWSKLICSLGGDLANSLLDVMPALFFGLLLQGAKLFPGLLWGIAIVSVSAYATSVGTFIDLSVSVNAGQTLKSMVQLIFIYFGILPDLVLAGILISLGQPFFAMLAVTVFNLALSALFLYFASLLMGRK